MSGRSDITHEDVMRILQIVDKSEDIELHVEYDGLKLHVSKGMAASSGAPALPLSQPPREQAAEPRPASKTALVPSLPEPAPATDSSAVGLAGATIPAGALTITAPLLGRFYRASSPSEPPFVEVGSTVSENDTVGVVEVMKLFNEIKAGVRGTIIEIRTDNEAMVEEDQVLFVVRPE